MALVLKHDIRVLHLTSTVLSLMVAASVSMTSCGPGPNTSPVSISSCGDLGWTNAGSYGSTSVCGGSKDITGSCSGTVVWSAARTFCEDMGARLCTSAELLNDEAKTTGCSLDRTLVWSSSEDCPNGHSVAPGSTGLGTAPTCEPDLSSFAVRCCADVPAPCELYTVELYDSYGDG